jgi:hypothetical protein
MPLLSDHEALALLGAVLSLIGVVLAVEGTGRPMFVRHRPAGGLDGRVRRAGLGAVVLGVAVAAAALATG